MSDTIISSLAKQLAVNFYETARTDIIRSKAGKSISPQYLAGFMDGEGTVNIAFEGVNERYVLRLIVTNTNKEILELIQKDWGGKIQWASNHKKPNWKPWASVRWEGKYAIAVLREIRPFLIVKQPQAILAECFWNYSRNRDDRCDVLRKVNSIGRNTSYKVKTDTAKVIDCFYKMKMNSLNAKGVKHA